jgi:glycosyltransferase involved in cell wall biosynthesis
VRHNNCYVYSHTPPRYLYSPERYDLTPRSQLALSLLRRPFVRLDRRAARAKRAYASNSLATSKRIRDLYGLTAPVIYPPLSTGHLPRDIKTLPAQPQLLMVSRLLPYKGVDIAIEAANLLHIPLTIIGDGPEMARLKSLAGPTVTLEGRVSDAVLADLFQESSAVLVPGVEDFGYGPIEAHWAGRPVIAFAAGGALETVHEGLNGLLVDSKDPSAWESAIEKALGFAWDPEAIRESTAPYRVDRFEAAVHEWLSPAASSEG